MCKKVMLCALNSELQTQLVHLRKMKFFGCMQNIVLLIVSEALGP